MFNDDLLDNEEDGYGALSSAVACIELRMPQDTGRSLDSNFTSLMSLHNDLFARNLKVHTVINNYRSIPGILTAPYFVDDVCPHLTQPGDCLTGFYGVRSRSANVKYCFVIFGETHEDQCLMQNDCWS